MRSLVYADDLKGRLLNYIHSTVAFSAAEVDFNIVTWNRSARPLVAVQLSANAEQSRAATWPAWNGEDQPLPSSRPKAGDPVI